MQTDIASPETFDPAHLRPEASLNRTRIGAVPGANPNWIGIPAHELLSLAALESLSDSLGFARRGSGHASDGQSPAIGAGVGVTWSLARALSIVEDASLRETDLPAEASRQGAIARTVAEIYGRRLAHLIATLIGGYADSDPLPVLAVPAVRVREQAARGNAADGAEPGPASSLGLAPAQAAASRTAPPQHPQPRP